MANLTVTIEDDLLQKARKRAVAEKTSVNALVREYLTRYGHLYPPLQRRLRLAWCEPTGAS